VKGRGDEPNVLLMLRERMLAVSTKSGGRADWAMSFPDGHLLEGVDERIEDAVAVVGHVQEVSTDRSAIAARSHRCGERCPASSRLPEGRGDARQPSVDSDWLRLQDPVLAAGSVR
jgi:hypothetical protein